MPRPRLPWFKMWVGTARHAKVVGLSDRAHRVWTELLEAASEQKERGRFDSYAAAAAIVRRKESEVRMVADAGLMDVREDGVWMHDWKEWQRWRPEDTAPNNTGTTPDEHLNHSNKTRESLANHSNKTGIKHGKNGLLARAGEDVDVEGEEDRDEDVDGEPPAPAERPPTRMTKPAKIRRPISNEAIERLVAEYAPQFGDEPLVRDWIARALNHSARLKALDESLYVERTWLKPELEKHKARVALDAERRPGGLRVVDSAAPQWVQRIGPDGKREWVEAV